MTLHAQQGSQFEEITVQDKTPINITGMIGLFSAGERFIAGAVEHKSTFFRDWKISDLPLENDLVIEPIISTQYSIDENRIKLLAQFAPVMDSGNNTATLELFLDQEWIQISETAIDPISRTGVFDLIAPDNFELEDIGYRVRYSWQARDYFYSGIFRKPPSFRDTTKIASTNCDNAYSYPHTHVVNDIISYDPDILVFGGDNIYQGRGGYGFNFGDDIPIETAFLDYLRKTYLVNMSYRNLTRNRPTLSIMDDHDYYQGNIWGDGGRVSLDRSLEGGACRQNAGGFCLSETWVNAMQRVMTGQLPTRTGNTTLQSGIETYFTDLNTGGVSIAILEDRKFKTPPIGNNCDRQTDCQILGDNQLNFLTDWSTDWNQSYIKLALSQTLLSQATTHVLPSDSETVQARMDLDTNGWPTDGRNKAVSALKKAGAFSLVGDQHLGSIAHLGDKHYQDSSLTFMSTGLNNGLLRAWDPKNRMPFLDGDQNTWDLDRGTGDFIDLHGHRLSILAATNATIENGGDFSRSDPNLRAQQTGSGYATLELNKQRGTFTFDQIIYPMTSGNPQSFPGWPQTFSVADNVGALSSDARFLPPITYEQGPINRPILQVIDQQNDEVLYTIRVPQNNFSPPVFGDGPYIVRRRQQSQTRWTDTRDVRPVE